MNWFNFIWFNFNWFNFFELIYFVLFDLIWFYLVLFYFFELIYFFFFFINAIKSKVTSLRVIEWFYMSHHIICCNISKYHSILFHVIWVSNQIWWVEPLVPGKTFQAPTQANWITEYHIISFQIKWQDMVWHNIILCYIIL